ncbi:amylo-alpha-1,6-glucosidase [Oceanobacillus sojae]|uniref:amylo-alpha-1,6-glucosidase n=1 Tax=Oceanobacillus sojae TaxID=582851 RepID=UPI0009887510|nr:trehalase family glycosidase [Oceanobacillus sojae]
MTFDIKKIPFSRHGSYLSVSYLKRRKGLEEGLYLRNIRGGDDNDGAVFKLDVLADNEIVPFESILEPTYLELVSEHGSVKLVMEDVDNVYLSAENVGIRFTLVRKAYDNAFLKSDKSWQINVFSKKINFMTTILEGNLDVDAPWNVNGSKKVIIDFLPSVKTNKMRGILEEFTITYKNKELEQDFEVCHQKVKESFYSWEGKVLSTPEKYEQGKKQAAYITWSSMVRKEGKLTRSAMYMSKNWMTNIWSWDHCFNAMALLKHQPELAWDQLMIFFENQDSTGMLPDFINDEFAYWNCTKPPIHGWTVLWMLDRSENISNNHLEEIYTPLSKWTNWYFEYRDNNKNGFPEYYHGNDSGWDNSTVFSKGIPVESPDVCAFLVLQMEALEKIAQRLQKEEEARRWKQKQEELLTAFLDYFWKEDYFTAYVAGQQVKTGDSLLLFMPIVLGKKLPKDILNKLVEGLKDESRFLTDNGLATESVSSTYYESDGYWRGPIWAPSTMLIIDGLYRAGEVDFARELSKRFCNMANKNGMAENFNAVTGEGLRDRAFTWTSSVFLILANAYVNK